MTRKTPATKRSIQPTTSSNNAIPPPFKPAPSTLTPFLDTLDKSKVYITHIDRHPAAFKRQVFAVPVALNGTILLLLLWRLYAAIPIYLSYIFSILGHPNDTTIDYKSSTWERLIWITMKRTAMIFFDYILIMIVWPWPISFFWEAPANPVSWRWSAGFRGKEVYVRVSRGWGAKELIQGNKRGDESPFFKVRILPAIDRQFMQKTGYLMMGIDWDLDFDSMITATKLVDENAIPLEALEKMVVVWVGTSDGKGEWAAWEVHKLDEGAETESRDKIMEFKEKLTAMGKEDLFFRWVEIVQFESNAPGGFTKERKMSTMHQVAGLFKEHGVDFDEFARSVGGLDGMEGMEGGV